jgi:hypothetical protein
MYGHWVTIIMVFVAGLGGQSLFALGYLIAAFIFLWKGNDLVSLNQNYNNQYYALVFESDAYCEETVACIGIL